MAEHALLERLQLPSDRIIIAYDGMEWPQILETAADVGPYTGHGKTNSKHVRRGADFAVNTLAENGQLTMLDSKFHDIPGTVEDSVYEATLAGASLITVHAAGGIDMLKGAMKGRERARSEVRSPFMKSSLPLIGNVLGITVLTSLKDEAFSIFNLDRDDKDAIKKKVVEFAYMALDAGLDGIVCSPLETEAIRANSNFDGLLVVNPGITPRFAVQAADQARSKNAQQAMEAGANFVVVGRGINKANDYSMTKAEAAIETGKEVAAGLGIAA